MPDRVIDHLVENVMKMPLDNATFKDVSDVLERCIWTGASAAEQLNKEGFILSPATRLEIERSILGRLLNDLSVWEPHEMMRRLHLPQDGCTPAEMYRAVQGYIQEFKDSLKEQR